MSQRQPRVGLAFAGDPTDPAAWSGIPVGIGAGLAASRCEPVPLPATPPAPLAWPLLAAGILRFRSRLDAGYGASLAGLRGAAVRRRLSRVPALDAIVQIGSEYELPPGTPFAYLCDMTLEQARTSHPVFARLSQSVFESWSGRQRRIARDANSCLAPSKWTAESLVSDYEVPQERVHVIGLGANHRPQHVERDWTVPRFLFVGREWERKNGPLLVRCFRRLRERLPEAQLDVVGGHPPLTGPGITGHGQLGLERPDHRRRLEELFAKATCFVMPSSCEPLGIVHVEAAFAGVPSIGSAVGGAGEVIGEDGLLVQPGNEGALLGAMSKLAQPDLARRMGASARAKAPLFTWEAVAERIMRALEVPHPNGRQLAAFLG